MLLLIEHRLQAVRQWNSRWGALRWGRGDRFSCGQRGRQLCFCTLSSSCSSPLFADRSWTRGTIFSPSDVELSQHAEFQRAIREGETPAEPGPISTDENGRRRRNTRRRSSKSINLLRITADQRSKLVFLCGLPSLRELFRSTESHAKAPSRKGRKKEPDSYPRASVPLREALPLTPSGSTLRQRRESRK